jgi:hypothetical protein
LKKRIAKIFAKKSFIKFEDLYPRPDYSKKNKNNEGGGVLFARFMASIGNFGTDIYDFRAALLWI